MQPSLTQRARLGIPRHRQGPGDQSPPAGAPEHVPDLLRAWLVGRRVSLQTDTPGLQRSFPEMVAGHVCAWAALPSRLAVRREEGVGAPGGTAEGLPQRGALTLLLQEKAK